MIRRFLVTNGPRNFFIFENDFENYSELKIEVDLRVYTADMSIKLRVQRPSCEMALW